ncbi:MAG: Smr/MutS family protein [Lewinellaceae bacterium]|nr:Smr/MutS family protein [Lewinella sp.]MCB9278229.1 Smr/MutS family protein [Lewinellaceae bacterium]
MELEPKDLFEKLEFDKILALVKRECLGELGKEAIGKLGPSGNLLWIKARLEEVHVFKQSVERNDPFPLRAYEDLSEDLSMLEIEGYVLPVEGLQRINNTLQIISRIFKYFNRKRQEDYPVLYAIVQKLEFDEELSKAIEKVIDEEGNIRPDASPELMKISKGILSKQKELDRLFRIIVNEYRSKGWLTDNVETFRNNRRVLSVPAEHKRKIRGIIHDESATGKTAFIEPDGVIAINNDIFDLEQEYKREIYRILKALSATLSPYTEHLAAYQETIVRVDQIQAKARLAAQMNGYAPNMVDRPHFGILKGFHPLLFLKNKAAGKKTVPFDLSLIPPNRLLVLSGPNAGGKSVAMKSAGLLQLMVQSGLLVPVSPVSEMGIFDRFFADIGDQQSLEDDLSTYSSRLANARVFLEKADKRTLVLIDEFGSGTDPKIGGAIAEAVLKELNQQGVFGVITTHYSNLKVFAFKTKGLVNGCMLFDAENLAPTYELKVGRPGSSYAFEIAEKSRLGDSVLSYARQKIGKNEKAVDELLIDLQREKQEVEEILKDLQEKQQSLDKLIKSYDQMSAELEYKRKKFKLESKETALQENTRTNREFEKLIREIKEQQNLEKAKELSAKVREERNELAEQVQDLRSEIYYKPTDKDKKADPIREGDFVKLKSGSAAGQVESVSKNKAVVLMGDMRLTINLRDLQHAREPLDVRSSRSVQADVDQASGFQNKLDIRGMRYEEALKLVEDFVDMALVSNAHSLRIVHGKGTGILRNAVRQKLREYNVDMKISHPAAELGGDGVTIVEM